MRAVLTLLYLDGSTEESFPKPVLRWSCLTKPIENGYEDFCRHSVNTYLLDDGEKGALVTFSSKSSEQLFRIEFSEHIVDIDKNTLRLVKFYEDIEMED